MVERVLQTSAGVVELPSVEQVPEDSIDDNVRVGVVEMLQESIERLLPMDVVEKAADQLGFGLS